MSEPDIVVIGAGAAGIAAARRVQAAGRSVRVIEARSRLGGRAFTRVVEGIALDLGCGWLHSAEHNDWTARADELGFALDRTLPPWSRRSGNLGFAQGEEPDFIAALQRLYTRLEEGADAPDRAAAELLEPGSRWNGLLNALSSWINGAELDKISVHDWGRYEDTGLNWRVEAGYGALLAAYGAPLDVTFDCTATLVDHSRPRLRIETTRGELQAAAAIVTVPTAVIAEERLRFRPALPDKISAAHDLPLGLADKLFIGLDAPDDFPRERRLFGATDTMRTGSYHFRPLGRPVAECYFGGALARELESGGERAFFAFAAEQIAAHFGADVRKRIRPLAATAWAADPHALGSYSYARVGRADARAALAAPVGERLFFAGEAISTADFSTAHGAYRTGAAAAEAVLHLTTAASA